MVPRNMLGRVPYLGNKSLPSITKQSSKNTSFDTFFVWKSRIEVQTWLNLLSETFNFSVISVIPSLLYEIFEPAGKSILMSKKSIVDIFVNSRYKGSACGEVGVMVRLLFSSNDTLLRCKSKDGLRGLQGFNGGDDLKCEFAFDNFSALFSSIRNDYLARWVTPQP